MISWRFIFIRGPGRAISTSCMQYGTHYDALGVTPKATQSEIKTAYYKLSKVHHPDRSGDEESAKKFRKITEAYEVLGNVKLKKMYDKGLTVGIENTTRMDYQPEPEPTDPTLKFYKSRTKRHIIPTMDGRTPIYDFDTWSKQHYGEVLKKNKYDRELLRKKMQKRADAVESTKQEAVFYIMIGLVGLFMMLVANGTSEYDRDTVTIKEKKKDS